MSYGGENGFNQAIELAAESLQNVKFIQEKKLIGKKLKMLSMFLNKCALVLYRVIEWIFSVMRVFKFKVVQIIVLL